MKQICIKNRKQKDVTIHGYKECLYALFWAITSDAIFVTVNIVIDAMQHTVKDDYTHPELDWVGEDKLIFIIAHRRKNLGTPMHDMFRAIRRV